MNPWIQILAHWQVGFLNPNDSEGNIFEELGFLVDQQMSCPKNLPTTMVQTLVKKFGTELKLSDKKSSQKKSVRT